LQNPAVSPALEAEADANATFTAGQPRDGPPAVGRNVRF